MQSRGLSSEKAATASCLRNISLPWIVSRAKETPHEMYFSTAAKPASIPLLDEADDDDDVVTLLIANFREIKPSGHKTGQKQNLSRWNKTKHKYIYINVYVPIKFRRDQQRELVVDAS